MLELPEVETIRRDLDRELAGKKIKEVEAESMALLGHYNNRKAFVGLLELGVMKDSANGAEPGEFPGDFRNGALDFGWDTFDEETKLSKRAIELNNGRAAMMGILGLMVHEKLNEIDMVADLPIIGVLQ